ncbi:hypothetical protein [Tsukamurella sp. NPDC003166]|uniref:hypothetical protein n=1 Tax=Tsukamurella sp. NPDC003166 TaxID=3154444 RepID=UPI0033A9867F
MSLRRTEAALGRMLPAKVVTLLLAEPRGAAAVLTLIRRRRPAGQSFSHHRDVVIILWVVVAMTVLEGAVVDVLLRVILGPSPWVWIALGLHVYAVYMIVAVYAGMVTRPHSLDGAVLRLRSGLGAEVVVPVAAIEEASPGRFRDFDNSGWKVDGDGNATMASREANFRLALTPDAEVVVNGRVRPAPQTIHLTVDEPRRLSDALAGSRRLPGLWESDGVPLTVGHE